MRRRVRSPQGPHMSRHQHIIEQLLERLTSWIGSLWSLGIHTALFFCSFVIAFFGYAPWDMVLLVVTTIVSLEAIYLAIFIQMTVNRQARELKEVSEDVEEIQEDVEEIQEDVGEIQEDVEDIQEEVEELGEDEERDAARKQRQAVTLEQLTSDVRKVLADLERLK